MTFQRVLAGSKNVDVVYGPDDVVPLVVLNMGDAKSVNVEVRVTTLEGKTLAEIVHRDVQLVAGRTVKDLPSWKPGMSYEGPCVFEYCVSPTVPGESSAPGVR